MEGGVLMLERVDVGVEGLDEDSGTDVEEVAGRGVQGVVLEPVGVVGVAGEVVWNELTEDGGGGIGNTGELLTLPVDGGIVLVDVTWVVETVVLDTLVLDTVSVVQDVVPGVRTPTGVGIMLLSQEVSLPYWYPVALRAGPTTARTRTANIIAVSLGMLKLMLSGECEVDAVVLRHSKKRMVFWNERMNKRRWWFMRTNRRATVIDGRRRDGEIKRTEEQDYMDLTCWMAMLPIDGKQD
jgi:hypothetical protein